MQDRIPLTQEDSQKENKIIGKVLSQTVPSAGQQVALEQLGCQLKQKAEINIQNKGSLWVNVWGKSVTGCLYLNMSYLSKLFIA